MGFELQLEDVLLVDAVGLPGGAHAVAQQGEAGQGVVVLEGGTVWLHGRSPATPLPWQWGQMDPQAERVGRFEVRQKGTVGMATPSPSEHPYLMCFVEEQAEIGEDHPELLPAITVFELS